MRFETLTAQEMETLIVSIHQLEPSSPESKRAEQRLLLSVRGYIVAAAQDVSRKMGVAVEDLVQEGLLAAAGMPRKFRPGQSPGKCLYPAFILRIARQAMMRWAVSEKSPVRVTRWAKRRVKKAKTEAASSGRDVSEVLKSMNVTDAAVAVLGHGSIQAGVSPEVLLRTADAGATADGEALREDALDKLSPALGRMSHSTRWVLRATFGIGIPAELSDRAIASQTGTSVAEVQRIRAAAIKSLRKSLGAHP